MKRIKKSPYTPVIVALVVFIGIATIGCGVTAQKTGQSFREVVYNSIK